MSDGSSRRESRTLLEAPRLLKRAKLSQMSDVKSPSPSAAAASPRDTAFPKYAHISYAPATKTTVVTTTTTTTTSFPAFLVEPPRDLHARDPQLYPLASSPTPTGLTQFSFPAGGRTAIFRESTSNDGMEEGPRSPRAAISCSKLDYNKEARAPKRTALGVSATSPQDPIPQTFNGIPKKTRHRLRGINNSPITPRSRTMTRSQRYVSNDSTALPQNSPVSLAGDLPDSSSRLEDSSTEDDISNTQDEVPGTMPPSPPSFISVPAGVATPPIGEQDFDTFESLAGPSENVVLGRETSPQTAQDNSLPSPMLSPVTAAASPVLADEQFDETEETMPSKAPLPFSEEEIASIGRRHANSASSSDTPLADLFKLIDTFDSYPIELQKYAMYQLLRRSSKHLLQFTAAIVNPALKCDFLTRLPTELSLNIIQYLDAKTLCRAAQVSRRWRELTDSYDQVWKDLVEEEGFALPAGELERAAREGWKWQAVMPAEKDLSASLLRSMDQLTPQATPVAALTRSQTALKRGLKRSADVMESDQKRQKLDTACEHSTNSTIASSRAPLRLDLHALTADLPELGLKTLRVPHLYKSIYRRHHGFRSSWMDPDTKPHHIAFQAHGRHVVTCLQFDNDKILTGSDDTKINVWDTSSGASRKQLLGHEGGVWALQYDSNTLVSGSTDRTVRIWDIEKGKCQHVFHGHTSTVRCLVILKPVVVGHTDDGTPIMMPKEPLIITGSRDSSLRVWKLPKASDPPFNQDGRQQNTDAINPYFVRALHGHVHSVRAIAAYGDTLVSGSYDSTVRVWRISNGDLVHRLVGHTQKVYSVILDHERNRCISGSMDNLVKVWSLETGQCIFNLEGHSSLVGLLDLNHNRLVSAAADWSLRIWDPETGHCRNTLAAHTGPITCFQHDGMKVVSGSDRSLKMWNVETGDMSRDLLNDLSGGWQVRFNDRKCVAAVQRNNRTYIEVLDFGAARDGVPAEKLGVRTIVDACGVEVADHSSEEDLEE